MNLHFTPENVAAVYDCLRTFQPFSRWKLPPSEEVIFRITSARDCQGQFRSDAGGQTGHQIDISDHWCAQFDTFVGVVAHEMIHMRQALRRTDRGGLHNAEFRRLAKQVCKRFQWDHKQFTTS